jgi:hypothetical protein
VETTHTATIRGQDRATLWPLLHLPGAHGGHTALPSLLTSETLSTLKVEGKGRGEGRGGNAGSPAKRPMMTAAAGGEGSLPRGDPQTHPRH